MKRPSRTLYRIVSDYGFGDKAWLKRFLPAEEAVKEFNDQITLGQGEVVQTIEQALDYEHPIYSIETDHDGDEEDWDWLDLYSIETDHDGDEEDWDWLDS